MIHAYAIEPACVVGWCRRHAFRLVAGSFGIGTPRILLEFPKFSNWKKAVFQAAEDAGLSELDRSRLEELFKLFGSKRVRREGTTYDGNRPWLENAEAEYERHPFAAIIAMDNPREHAAVLLESDVGDPNNSLWHKPTAATPPRTPQGIAEVVKALVDNCKEMHLVDPYFAPDKKRWRRVLEALMRMVAARTSGVPRVICVHCGTKYDLSFFEKKASDMAAHLPWGITVRFKRWRERDHGEKLHNRYVLTDIGGVVFGVGLDSGAPAQTDDVNLMGRTQYLKRWEQFTGKGAFDLVDEPRPITGKKM